MEKDVLIIGMTNMINNIDPAALRQGRFDHKINVELPDEGEVRDLLHTLAQNSLCSKDLDIEPLVKTLSKKPLSDADFVFREASRLAARMNKEALDNECLALALKNLPPAPNAKPIGFLR
jgi:ATP-dependent 26S proteasome regulatory subunit